MWCGSEPWHVDLPTSHPPASHHSTSDGTVGSLGSTSRPGPTRQRFACPGRSVTGSAAGSPGRVPARPSAPARHGRSYLGHRDVRRRSPSRAGVSLAVRHRRWADDVGDRYGAVPGGCGLRGEAAPWVVGVARPPAPGSRSESITPVDRVRSEPRGRGPPGTQVHGAGRGARPSAHHEDRAVGVMYDLVGDAPEQQPREVG